MSMKAALRTAVANIVDCCIALRYMPDSFAAARFLRIASAKTILERLLLYSIAKDSAVTGDVLEIGSLAGASAILLAAGNEASPHRGTLWLVEPRPQPSPQAFRDFFAAQHLDAHVRVVEKTSEEARKDISPVCRFIFIDGNHEYGFVKKDILFWLDRLQAGAFIAFHDADMAGVARAIDECVTHKEGFTVLGTIGTTLYAVKDASRARALAERFVRIYGCRERCIGVARRLGMKGDGTQ